MYVRITAFNNQCTLMQPIKKYVFIFSVSFKHYGKMPLDTEIMAVIYMYVYIYDKT